MRNASRSLSRNLLPPIRGNSRDKNRADKSVALEESAVDPGQVEFPGAAMFVDERGGDKRHGRVIDRSKSRGETERDEREKHPEVEPLRETQALRYSEFHDQGTQPFPAIEINILRGVNQIETGHPADNSGAQDQWRQIESASLRDPGSGRRDRERETE